MLFLLLTSLLTSSAFSVGWAPDNNPYRLGKDFKNKLVELPATGKFVDQRLGWPGNHWPNYVGGVASRWSAGIPQNFSYKFNTLEDLKALEPHQLAELSPAEKFDILSGDYTYSKVRQVYRTVSPSESEWHGICHGYAPASLNHPEPASVTLTNPDGINVHFYSSDVAALMSFYYANISTTPITLIGNRCNYLATSKIPRRSRLACEDINAGAFHLVLTNKLGLEGVGFIADIDRYFEIWNHVAVNYQTTYRAESSPVASSGYTTVKRVHVETIVSYAAAIAPKFAPVLGTENALYAQQTYEYYLDLDKSDAIVGGDWISEARPDFLWTQSKSEFLNDWSGLNQIYTPANLLNN